MINRTPNFLLTALIIIVGLLAAESNAKDGIRVAPTVAPVVEPGFLVLLAGSIEGPGSADGPGLKSQFSSATDGDYGIDKRGIASDAAGNLYVADSANHAIRKIDTTGWVTTVAGKPGNPGSADGNGAEARFNFPIGIVSDAQGMLHVTDSYNNTVRKITPDGVVTTLAGTAGKSGWVDGEGSVARFRHPVGITRNTEGDVFVMDMYNACIRKISPSGVVKTLAGQPGQSGFNDGFGATAHFGFAQGIAAAANGVLYVADGPNHAIRRITPEGAVTTVELTPTVDRDGHSTWTKSSHPDSVAVDRSGNLYLIDRAISVVAKDGKVSVLAGVGDEYGHTDGKGRKVTFTSMGNAAFDLTGNLYVADVELIRKITPQGNVTTVAGQSVKRGRVNGIGSEARFDHPTALAADGRGNIFAMDEGNKLLRKIDAAGIVTTVTGLDNKRESLRDGAITSRTGFSLTNLAADANGNLYVADDGENIVKKISPAGVSNITDPAGRNVKINGPELLKQIGRMYAMISDKTGNLYLLYVSSTKETKTVLKINTDGVVTTIKTLGDDEARIGDVSPNGVNFTSNAIAIDINGNVFLSDSRGMRKIDAAGNVTAIGDFAYSYRFETYGGVSNISYSPTSMVLDDQGNIYFAVHTMIRKLTPDGVLSTIAGIAGQYDIRTGSQALLDDPTGLVMFDPKTLALISRNAILKLRLP